LEPGRIGTSGVADLLSGSSHGIRDKWVKYFSSVADDGLLNSVITLTDEKLAEKLEILDEVSSGAFSTLYRVRQRALDRIAAMKVLNKHNEGDILTRFRREAKALSSINHPNVVQIFDHGELSDGRPYIIMQYVNGETLTERLSKGTLPDEEAQSVLLNLCDALDAVHAMQVIHRDLKPDNMWIGQLLLPRRQTVKLCWSMLTRSANFFHIG